MVHTQFPASTHLEYAQFSCVYTTLAVIELVVSAGSVVIVEVVLLFPLLESSLSVYA